MSDQTKPALYALTPAQHATVMAALRLYQHELGIHTSYVHYDAIRTIASGDESWPRLTAKQIDPLCKGLDHGGLDIGDVVNILGAADDDPYVAAAQEKNTSDSVSLDGNPVVSYGEGGAQVMAWIWVSDDDAGVEGEGEGEEAEVQQ